MGHRTKPLTEVTYNTNFNPRKLMLITALFCVVTQRVVVLSYPRFGTTYGSHLHETDGTNKVFPETSEINYHYSLHNSPEERSSHLLRGGSLNHVRTVKLFHLKRLFWRTRDGLEMLLRNSIMKPAWHTFYSICWESRASACFEHYLLILRRWYTNGTYTACVLF
jgi:hypothetical protein